MTFRLKVGDAGVELCSDIELIWGIREESQIDLRGRAISELEVMSRSEQ